MTQIIETRTTQQVCYHLQLYRWFLGLKQDLPSQQLRKHTPHRPHIYLWSVMLATSQQLRRPVVLSHHLERHGHILVWFNPTSKAKITNLQTDMKQNVSAFQNYLSYDCSYKDQSINTIPLINSCCSLAGFLALGLCGLYQHYEGTSHLHDIKQCVDKSAFNSFVKGH